MPDYIDLNFYKECYMKKVLAFLFTAVLVASLSCSKSPESQAKALVLDMAKLTETSAEKMEKAATAKEAGDALLEYAANMKTLALQGRELEKKYPELKKENNPALKAEEDVMMKSMEKFTRAMTSAITKYAASKEFQDAMSKMSELMKN